ncbi:MAG TPA: hypothetical protein VKN99_11290 [Polyangia bacterium]|nr:hypothetical protein [Polyangia bacterium]
MKTFRLLRFAALLIVIGLVVELGTLGWSHPTAFVAFMFVGGATMAAGILLYLYWLIQRRPDETPREVSEP